jgi:predicted aldo/keto reductase-like oxidoreductase
VLDQYRMATSRQTCRVGCNDCASSCPYDVPVSTVMRYSYYFNEHGLEKDAMMRYARLGGCDGSVCESCSAPCTGACPYGVDIRKSVLRAHHDLVMG